MKKCRKLLSLILVFTMMMTMSLTAFAATIAVKNAVEDGTYIAYKIFDVTSNTDEDGNTVYSYTTDNEELVEWIEDSDYEDYFDFEKNSSGSYNVSVSDGFDENVAKAFAEALAAAIGNGELVSLDCYELTYDKSGTATSENLDAGYYLITSSKGTLVILDTTDISIEEKNETPESEKTVDETSVAVGDTVTYTITITAQPGAENYILHDVMSEALELDGNSIVVTVGEEKLTEETDYTIYYTSSDDGSDDSSDDEDDDSSGSSDTYKISDGCTFEIVFAQTYLNTISEETEITITYTATVLANITTDGSVNNKVWLEYGDEYTTPPSQPYSYTYSLNIEKTDGSGEALTGAGFKLYYVVETTSTGDDGGTVTTEVKYYAVAEEEKDENGNGTGVYNITKWTTDVDEATELMVDNEGKLSIDGLDADVIYYLTETTVPDGYVAPTEDYSFFITATMDGDDGTLSGLTITVTGYDNDNDGEDDAVDGVVDEQSVNMTIQNTTGDSELPSTGGMGTTVLYAIGVVLVLGAGVVLVSKRRMRG